MKSFLFIGGSKDGLIMALPEKEETIYFPVLDERSGGYMSVMENPTVTTPEYRRDVYILDSFMNGDDSHKYFYYRHETFSRHDVITKLFANYKPVNQKECQL